MMMMGGVGWGAQNLNNKPEEISSSSGEREARSIALEKAYVHDVYSQIASHFADSRYRAWPRVKQFLLELEPGSIVCDVGCGNGKYLDVNPSIYKIGIDRCSNLTGAAREKNHEVLISDNLNIPFRDDCFDAVISIAVIHHFATTERRVAALKELARVLRIGGRLMVSVWAMEQRHRRFESQDVLVPWSRPLHSSSDDKTSSIERDLNSTTTTTSDDADDGATHYHAYTQTSDSDHSYPCSFGGRKRGRHRHRGRSIDPTCPSSSQSSSDLSSPNESCYTFVRKALQKLAGRTRRNRGGRRPWFLQGLDIPMDEEGHHLHFASLEEDVYAYSGGGCGDDGGGCGGEMMEEYGGQLGGHLHHPNGDQDQEINADFMPIELRKLEAADYGDLFQSDHPVQGVQGGGGGENKQKSKPTTLFSNVLYSRRRTLEAPMSKGGSGPGPGRGIDIANQPKSKSLSDLFGLIPGAAGILRSQRKSTEELLPTSRRSSSNSRRNSKNSGELYLKLHFGEGSSPPLGQGHEEDDLFPTNVSHKLVQTEEGGLSSCESLTGSLDYPPGLGHGSLDFCGGGDYEGCGCGVDPLTSSNRLRPVLVKQKQSIISSPASGEEGGVGCEDGHHSPGGLATPPPPSRMTSPKDPMTEDLWGEMKRSVKDLPELRRRPSTTSTSSGTGNTLQVPSRSGGILGLSSSFWKQSSLNEELMHSERLKEKAVLKAAVQKQRSLNEDLIYKQSGSGGTWDKMKEAILNSPNSVKSLANQIIRNGLSSSISSAFRGGSDQGGGGGVNGVNGQSTSPGGGGGNGEHNRPGESCSSSAGSSDIGLSTPSPTGQGQGRGPVPPPPPPSASTSIRNGIQLWIRTCGRSGQGGEGNGIVRMIQNWKGEEPPEPLGTGSSYAQGQCQGQGQSQSHPLPPPSQRSSGRGLFPPFFLRRSSAGSLNSDHPSSPHHPNKVLSPPPHHLIKRRPSENELLLVSGGGGGGSSSGSGGSSSSGGTGGGGGGGSGGKLFRKLSSSREEGGGSDSSKDSSFQSDTSVDSEDSFASVIFIPMATNGGGGGGGQGGVKLDGSHDTSSCFSFNTETRANSINSTDSDRSPKSPVARLSPGSYGGGGNLPKSPSPLASEHAHPRGGGGGRSPEVSPSGGLGGGYYSTSTSGGGGGSRESPKFVFDECATKRLLSPGRQQQEVILVTGSGGDEVIGIDAGIGQELSLIVVTLPEEEPEEESPILLEVVEEVMEVPQSETSEQGSMPMSMSTFPEVPLTSTSTSAPEVKHASRRKGGVEKIQVVRKPAIFPELGSSKISPRQLVRRSLPKSMAMELFNPERDDADTSEASSSSSSSSPNSVSSLVPVSSGIMEEGAGESSATNDPRPHPDLDDPPTTKVIPVALELGDPSSKKILESSDLEKVAPEALEPTFPSPGPGAIPPSTRKGSLNGSTKVLEVLPSSSSLEEGGSGSGGGGCGVTRRRLNLTQAKLGSTSEWLISLPSYSDMSSKGSHGGGSTSSASTSSTSGCGGGHYPGPGPLLKRSSLERRHERGLGQGQGQSHSHDRGSGGEKLLLGDLKKYSQKGPDAKWPSSMMDDSPPNSAPPTSGSHPSAQIEAEIAGGDGGGPPSGTSASAAAAAIAELNAKLLEEMEEGDSLFDSIENLSTSRQHPSRNPSLETSYSLSLSLLGSNYGESFESWSSAKSSLTNSSSTHQPPSVPQGQSQGQGQGQGQTQGQGHPPEVRLLPPTNPTPLPVPIKPGPCPTTTGNLSIRSRDHQGHQTREGHRSGGSGQRSRGGGGGGGDDHNNSSSSTPLTYHRYYHVFREGELDKLIEKYVQNLHIISSYYDHANWCIIAEKVQVWTI